MDKDKKTKYENYKKLFDRIKIALDNKFYFEAMWLAYAIIEDRLKSSLLKCGGNKFLFGKIKGKDIKMLGPKIMEIKKRQPVITNLNFAYYDDILDRINKWSKDRNKLMHALAEETKPISTFNELIKNTATNGNKIARELSSRIRKLKRELEKSKK